MKQKTYILYSFLSLLLSLVFSSCEMFEEHPYDVDIRGGRDINARNIARIEPAMAGCKTMRIAMISDTQRSLDDLKDAIKAINARDDIDFVLHGGDISDFGLTDEFEWTRDAMEKLTVPYVAVIGNHDCLGTGRDAYRGIYGEVNFAFTAGNVRFICLNTNALEYDYSEPVPDFNFLDRQLEGFPDEAEKTVFLMHACPGSEVFNNNVMKIFQRYVNMFPQVQFCAYGHNHQFDISDMFGDGIIYCQCPNVAKRKYLVFTIKEEGGFDCEAVDF